jgi:bifunctional UDP-N-acetylglucosamine pyrophosphorylase / glucosamine-1-phosphate N-acetyltransferase
MRLSIPTPIQPIILAAGKGTRMKSDLPKVLMEVAKKPMLGHVLDATQELSTLPPIVITGFGSEDVRKRYPNCQFVEQKEQLGTGHAVQMASEALDALPSETLILVLYGDVPLTQPETLSAVIEAALEGFGLLTVELRDPTGYGRIVRDSEGKVTSIVEQKDASEDQLRINEVNTGILAARAQDLNRWVGQLSNNNAQGEFYLTDIIAMAVSEGIRVNTALPNSESEVLGANDRIQLAQLERAYQQMQANKLMAQGVTLADPNRIEIRGSLNIGSGTFIDVNSIFEGDVILGQNVIIETNCVVRDSKIGNGCHIKAFSHIEKTSIGNQVEVGPYARLREGTELADHSKIGNFVETKKASIGKGSKVNHLSYVGDTEMGENTNIGAGSITCNYDGANKHKTKIGDNVFVGSNTALVAPVELKDGSTVGAGSTISKDVDEMNLALTRSKQNHIKNWKRPGKG